MHTVGIADICLFARFPRSKRNLGKIFTTIFLCMRTGSLTLIPSGQKRRRVWKEPLNAKYPSFLPSFLPPPFHGAKKSLKLSQKEDRFLDVFLRSRDWNFASNVTAEYILRGLNLKFRILLLITRCSPSFSSTAGWSAFAWIAPPPRRCRLKPRTRPRA